MQLVAGITGASGIFVTAKAAQVTGQTQAALSEEVVVAQPTSSPATDQKVDGHSQEAADEYQRSISNP
jgi:3-polyprenyl-4-hydroxybenzoate decarboxylase